MAHARAGDWIIVTADLDFAQLAWQSGQRKPSVVLLQTGRARIDRVIEPLRESLGPRRRLALRVRAVLIVEEKGVRVRNLPIS